MKPSTKLFLRDVFDVDVDESTLEPYVNNLTSQLDLRALFASCPAKLHASLVFQRLWKAVMRMYAPQALVNAYVTRYTAPSVDTFKDYMMANVPAFKVLYPKIVTDAYLNQEFDKATHELKNVGIIKRDIINKLAERYMGGTCFLNESDYQTNVFKTYRSIIDRGTEQLIATRAQSDQLGAKDIITYSSVGDNERPPIGCHEMLIKSNGYDCINPYNDYATKTKALADTDTVEQTVYDAVAERIAQDGSFYPLQLVSNHVVLVTEPDVDTVLIRCVLQAIAKGRPKENIMLLAHQSIDSDRVVERLDFNITVCKLHAPAASFYAVLPKGACRSFTYLLSSDVSAANGVAQSPMASDPSMCTLIACGRAVPCPESIKKLYSRLISVGRWPDGPGIQYVPMPVEQSKPSDLCSVYRIHQDAEFATHMLHHCMFGNPHDPTGVYLDFVARYTDAKADALALTEEPGTHQDESEQKNAVVVIDNRKNIMSAIAAKATFMNVVNTGAAWELVVVCRQEDVEFYRQRLGATTRYVVLPKTVMPAPSLFTMAKYNEMMKSTVLWDRLIAYHRVVLVQDDGFIVRRDPERLNKLLEYDYVGAPWDPALGFNAWMNDVLKPVFVGNGGLSIRNPVVMSRICSTYPSETRALHIDCLQPEPEDVFYARMCQKVNGNVPSFEEAQEFASEEVLKMDSLGFHKVYGYHPIDKVKAFFNAALTSTTL
jgi:hypothetical protein